MDYEKKYKEALELARVAAFNGHQNLMEGIFPELCESEDERIKKDIIDFVRHSVNRIPAQKFNKYIAWLEKQGKLPIPKLRDINEVVEQKFHEGDWVVSGRFVTQIREIAGDGYVNSHNGFISFEGAKYYHLWTIQDARDGDMLYSECLRILWIFKGRGTVYCGCNLNYNDGAFCGEGYIETPTDVIPATKEQRDFLFEKMKEAGYEWDAEHKQLNKIEQKFAEWSEENEHTLQGIIDEIQANKNQAPDYDLATYDRFLSWLKSLKQRNTWKPSDAQMASITCAVRKMKESACYDSELVSLLNDLKKLTE